MNENANDMVETGNIRLLIIDDSEDVRQALKDIFALTDDIEVIGEAINGQEGLEKTAELEPDIIIMDERMPVLNGLETSRIISEKASSSKIIMLTNYEDFRSEAYKNGVTAYLIKGVKLEILTDCIRKVHRGEAIDVEY
ncbi:MAG: response regulator transcription factor [Dehalococcoidales bacterium]|nr:response regulator transcription factor [Dehalococcoidales bacterium]